MILIGQGTANQRRGGGMTKSPVEKVTAEKHERRRLRRLEQGGAGPFKRAPVLQKGASTWPGLKSFRRTTFVVCTGKTNTGKEGIKVRHQLG